jgi:hypothetical protein
VPSQDIVIDPAYEGPPGSANGGYACGMLARFLHADAEVTLRKPVPLGVALRVEPHDGGVALYHEETMVAEATEKSLDSRAPAPPTFAEAQAASAAYPGHTSHPFPGCVGCGTARNDRDALRVFPGPLTSSELVAAVWRPTAAALADGSIRSEISWTALDCPAGWAALCFGRTEGVAVLGRMAARLDEPITAAEAYIVVGWVEGVAGRKLYAGSALYSQSGTLHGLSRQTWIRVAQ